MSKEFDIVIYGATSFAGGVIVSHMMNTYGLNSEVKWAIAGRNKAKLIEVKEAAGAPAIPHLIADSNKPDQLREMAARTKVILTTVGPYALYGEPLLKLCAETGTDYCDLTGEVQWYRQMLAKYEDSAKQSGARIVLCSGFDSIPSDMGVYHLQNESEKRFGETCTQVKNRVKSFKGGASGGSAVSFLNVAKETANDPIERMELKNPYSLCPGDHTFHKTQDEVDYAEYDDDFQSWIGTFVMAKINTRVVHRSNALQNNRYGTNFLYDEARLTGNGSKGRSTAKKISFGFRTFMQLGGFAPTRWLLTKLLPKSGQGPTEEEQENGGYVLDFLGKTSSGDTIRTRVTGDRDPGYGSTAKIIAESAICLSRLPEDTAGGFWTPSALYGDDLISRLQANAGVTFDVLNS